MADRTVAETSDALGEIRPKSPFRDEAFAAILTSLALHCRVTPEQVFSGSWNLGPDSQQAGFAVITEGDCDLHRPEAPAIRLTAGDVLLWPTASEHQITGLSRHFTTADSDDPWSSYGASSGQVRILAGTVRSSHPTRDPLAGLVDQATVFPTSNEVESALSRIASCLIAVGRDADSTHPEILNRLAEVLLLEALRREFLDHSSPSHGWLRAMADPEIGPILGEMAKHPEREWTVAMLADRGAMSRSTFARRFAEVMNCGPMDCLVDIRMRRACEHLKTDRPDLKIIARSCGYRSAAAFSAAFKRWCGLTPSEFKSRPDSSANFNAIR